MESEESNFSSEINENEVTFKSLVSILLIKLNCGKVEEP